MKKIWRRLVWTCVIAMVGFFLFMVWYDWKFSMDVVEGFEKGDPSSGRKVLVATQGSEFKDEITQKLTDKLAENEIYVQVIDVTSIEGTNIDIWDAMVIIHTWEQWKPQPDAEAFLGEYYDPKKMVVMTTSGSGEEMIDGVDGISGPSIMEDVDLRVDELYAQIESKIE